MSLPPVGLSAATTAAPAVVDPLVHIAGELGLVLVLAIVLGHLAQRLRLPAITGQLLAGVILGPTVLGHIAAAVHASFYSSLFPSSATDPVLAVVRKDFLQLGLVVFIFLVGLEVDPNLVVRRIRIILPSSLLGLAIPFAVGFAAVHVVPGIWYTSGLKQPGAMPWIIGVALSVSALPVIAAILTDLGLIRTEVGSMILAAAVLDDVCGWVAFAAIVSAFTGGGSVWQAATLVFATFAIALTIGRRVGSAVNGWLTTHSTSPVLVIGLALAATLMLSGVMEGIGSHAFFGALLVGVMCSAMGVDRFESVDQFARSYFAPLYFGALGLSVDFAANFDLRLVAVVLLIACLGKFTGVFLGARLGGTEPREALAIAAGMNARGSVEILLATLALNFALIDGHVFVAIVLMAIGTSILASAAIPRILQIARPATLVRSARPVLQRLDSTGRPVEEVSVGERLTIGRDPGNLLVEPDDQLLSREQAVIKQTGQTFRLENLGVTNPTLIWRGMRWQPVTIDTLHDGDIMVLGSSVFRFSLGASTHRMAAA